MRASRVLWAALAVTACGGAVEDGGASGGAETGGAATGGAETGGAATGGAETGGAAPGGVPVSPLLPTGECMVATRADECCGWARPITHGAAAADPCWLPPESGDWAAALHAHGLCLPEQDCALVDCAWQQAPPRTARRSEDACVLVDECATYEDCVHVSNGRTCCDCGGSRPRSLSDTDPCLGPSAPDECRPPGSCDGEPECLCPAVSYEVECVLGDDGFRRCL